MPVKGRELRSYLLDLLRTCEHDGVGDAKELCERGGEDGLGGGHGG